MCITYKCLRNSIIFLNILYIFIAFLLILIAAYGKAAAYFTSVALVGGIIACGVFLLLLAFVGLLGAVKHHQVYLFFYMIILFVLFLIQFGVACACLALTKEQQDVLLEKGWIAADNGTLIGMGGAGRSLDNGLRGRAQELLVCCGYKNSSIPASAPLGHPPCNQLSCCKKLPSAPCCTGHYNNGSSSAPDCPCKRSCYDVAKMKMDSALKVAGGVGLFFSLIELFGVWLAMRYRNQKNPRADPTAFL